METKELKIIPPEGYKIDKENSTFKCIKFKPKSLTYEDVAKKLFGEENSIYYIECDGTIANNTFHEDIYKEPNNGTSKKQLEKLLAINKLMNVAKYLNGDWKPNWKDNRTKYHPYINSCNNKIEIGEDVMVCKGTVYFKSKEFVQQAIGILGEDTIRLALSTDW